MSMESCAKPKLNLNPKRQSKINAKCMMSLEHADTNARLFIILFTSVNNLTRVSSLDVHM